MEIEKFVTMLLDKQMLGVLAALSIVFGVLFCFYGYRMFDVILAVLGFTVFGILVGTLVFQVTGHKVVAVTAGVVGGILGAFFLILLYFIGVFLLGAVFGILLAALISGGTVPYMLLLGAVIGGIFAVICQRFFIIVATSFLGGWGIVSGIFHFIGGKLDARVFFHGLEKLQLQGVEFYYVLASWVLLGVAGVIVQFKLTGRKLHRKRGLLSKKVAPGSG